MQAEELTSKQNHCVSTLTINNMSIRVDNNFIGNVSQFTYLGSIVAENGGAEVGNRIGKYTSN